MREVEPGRRGWLIRRKRWGPELEGMRFKKGPGQLGLEPPERLDRVEDIGTADIEGG